MHSIEQCAQPVVSVIIPVKNGKDYIQEAIDSVLNQDYRNLEVLILDDGSDDLDYQILAQQDPRIRVERLEGGGVSKARNRGMQIATGKYFAFLDADDVWFPGKITAQIDYLERLPKVGIVFGEFVRWSSDEFGQFSCAGNFTSNCAALIESNPARSGWIYTKLLLGLLVGMNTAVIRREIYEQIGDFDESMRVGEDYDFWLRSSQITEMHCLAGVVALYRIHPTSAMHKLDSCNHLADLLEKAKFKWGLSSKNGLCLSYEEFNSRLAGIHFSHAYSHYWGGDPSIAYKSFKKAFKGGSRRTKSLIYSGLSLGKIAQQAINPFKAIDGQRTYNLNIDKLSKKVVLKSVYSNLQVRFNQPEVNLKSAGAAAPPLWARFVSATIAGSLTGHAPKTLTIFTFHKVPEILETGFEGDFTLNDFRSFIKILIANFNILDLERGISGLQKNDLPRFAAAITFDDGYHDWITGVVPILEFHSIPATFFISTCQLQGNALWFERFYRVLEASKQDRSKLKPAFLENDLKSIDLTSVTSNSLLQSIKYLPVIKRDRLIQSCDLVLDLMTVNPLFTTEHLKFLRARGFRIGAHTVNHPILACCTHAEARSEIMQSKEILQDILREPVSLFSYPNGVPGLDIKPEHVHMVQEAGFYGAVTTALGAATHRTSILQLPRFDPWARTPGRLLIQYLMTQKRTFPVIEEKCAID